MFGMPAMKERENHSYSSSYKVSEYEDVLKISVGYRENLAQAIINAYVGSDVMRLCDSDIFDEVSSSDMGCYSLYRNEYDFPANKEDYKTYEFENKYYDGNTPSYSAVDVLSELFLNTDFCERLICSPGYEYSESSGGNEISRPFEITVSDGRISEYTEYAFSSGTSIEECGGMTIYYCDGELKLQDAEYDGYTHELNGIQSDINKFSDTSYTVGLKKLIVHCKKCRETIIVPEGVEDIDFAGCTSIEEIKLPSTVKRIRALAFDGCRFLKRITVNGTLDYAAKSAVIGCMELSDAPQQLLSFDRSALPDGTI